MNYILLSEVTGWLKWFSWIFGLIFNWLYNFIGLFGIENIALTLVLFTVVVKLIITPLTVKQQRFSKLSSKMQPELSVIQNKYKGKKDEQSMRLSSLETNEVYAKYGTSPTAGCLPMLIMLPLMFAMYKIIYAIPAYVSSIYDLYSNICHSFVENTASFAQYTKNGVAVNVIPSIYDFLMQSASTLGVNTSKWTDGVNMLTLNHSIDILTKFGTSNWEELLTTLTAANVNTAGISESIEKINSIFSVFGMNILNSPKYYCGLEKGIRKVFNPAMLVPVLAVVTQLGSSILQKRTNPTQNNNKNDDNGVAQSMNTMLYVLPFMSGFFCYGFSLVIGIFWIINTVVSVIQQVIINIYIDKTDIDAYIAKNVEKQNKKKEKLGLSSGSTMAELAKRQTKSIDYSYQVKTTKNYANIGGSSKPINNKKNVTPDANVNEGTDTKVSAPEKKSISGYAHICKRD